MKFALIVATVAALATPALAEEVGVGVGVGPVGAGVTVGEGHRDVVRDHDRDRTTVIKEREQLKRPRPEVGALILLGSGPVSIVCRRGRSRPQPTSPTSPAR